MIFSLIETNVLYNKLLSNNMQPKTKNEKILLKKLNIPIKKKLKNKFKKNEKVLVFFTLTIEECIKLNIDYSKKKIKKNKVTHFIEGKIMKYIDKDNIKIYFPIDKTIEIISINTIKKI